MVASIKNHTGQTNYTDHEISLVLYRQLISGWGFHTVPNTNPTQVIWPFLCLLKIFAQEKWLADAVNHLYNGIYQLINEDIEIQMNATLTFASQLCHDQDLACKFAISKGQNLITMLLALKIQGKNLPENPFKASSSVSVEKSAATTFCIGVNASSQGLPSRSGVGNGIEMIVDLETFDNGDVSADGDGADIEVMDPGDNPLAQLRGFSVSPGTSVDVKIRPNLFSITEGALGFKYTDRKCVEPAVDKGVDKELGKYSVSNCLFGATLEQIFKNGVRKNDWTLRQYVNVL